MTYDEILQEIRTLKARVSKLEGTDHGYQPLTDLRLAVRHAVAVYDATGDHVPRRQHLPVEDCVRCALIRAISGGE